MQKTLYIVRGLPGTGKTTLAHKLVGASNAIAADDFPGLYKDGIYQQGSQAQSHEWCQSTVDIWMQIGKHEIGVHNTFVQEEYMQPYINMALKYGYAIAIIHTEKVILETGDVATNIHSVPKPVIDSMRQKWESINKPVKKGITIKEIGEELKNLDLPDMILLDMDGTLKTTATGNTFPVSPDDAKINLELCRCLDSFKLKQTNFYIVSNQAGLQFKQKSRDFLEAEISFTLGLLKKENVSVRAAMFSPARNSNEMIRCDLIERRNYSNIYNCTSSYRTDKPNVGMGEVAIADYRKTSIDDPVIWVVGDGHTDSNSADWEFAKNLRAQINLKVSYIPVELFGTAAEII